MQKPILTPAQVAELAKKEPGSYGSALGHVSSTTVRERVFPGESRDQARRRWQRERQREIDLDHDQHDRARHVGGQVLAVRGCE